MTVTKSTLLLKRRQSNGLVSIYTFSIVKLSIVVAISSSAKDKILRKIARQTQTLL